MKLVAFAWMFAAGTASAAPFPTRDQNPLLAGFGLPTSMPASISDERGWSFAADLNWANTALVQASDDETLIIDAETHEARITIRRTLTDRLALQLQIPWRYTGAGSLDGFIDDWHDVFGLPDGARPTLREDQIRIAYARNGVTPIGISSSESALADVSADLGYELHSSASSSLTAWVSLEAPTGDAVKLTGNEALDASLILAGEHRFGDRWSVFAQTGVTSVGKGNLLPVGRRNVVWSALAGISWRAFQPVELQVQIDAHTAAFDDSELDFLNESIYLTVGGAIHFASGWRIDLGVSEDIAVETGPDVVFILGLRRE